MTDVSRSPQSRCRLLTRLHREERGVVAIMTALILTSLIGMLALTVDVGFAYGQRRLAQNVADSGALAGAEVVGEKLLNAPRTDGDVLVAIRDAARNSSGGFFATSTDYFTAVYVGGTYDPYGNGVVQEITPTVTVGSAPGGTIPSTARGVRVLPRKANPTFFAPAIGTNSLYAGATATALALDVVGFAAWAPYAIWAGELADRCNTAPYDTTSPLMTGSDPVAGTNDFVYGCIPFWGGTQSTPSGGPNGPKPTGPGGLNPNCWVPPGSTPPIGCVPTQVYYYSQSYQNRNVKDGDSADSPYGVKRWNVGPNSFKGYFHTNNLYLNVGDTTAYDSGGGYAQGSGDLTSLANCRNQNLGSDKSACLMVMPVVRYATGGGAVNLTVAGFLPVRLITDPFSNSNDMVAEITIAVLSSKRDVKTGPCPSNGIPCMKVTRLVQ